MGSETTSMSQMLQGVPAETLVPTLIGIIVGALLAAFFSFRFFKLFIILSGASIGFSFGYTNLGMFLGDRITAFDAALIVGIACAVVFALLATKFYRICVYLLGGLIGFAFGFSFVASIVLSLGSESAAGIAGLVFGLVLAVPGAILIYRCLKPYIIISTALTGSLLAAISTSVLIFGDNDVAMSVFAVLGVVLAVLSAIAQFKMNADRDLDL